MLRLLAPLLPIVVLASCGGARLDGHGDASLDSSTDANSDANSDAGVLPRGPGHLNLHSSSTGTDLVIWGEGDPTAAPVRFVTGTVDHDSTATLFVGSMTSNASGAGTFAVSASYTFPYQPQLSVAARDGAQRSDFAPPIALAVQITPQANGTFVVTVDGTTHTYTPFEDVVAAINLSDPMGPLDVFQLYNLGLLFSQVRIPAFGSLGMTRYITSTGHFAGFVAGEYTVAIQSLTTPTATLAYTAVEDLPGETYDGTIVTKVNISGSGPMEGVMTFRMTGGTSASPVVYEGSVDYANVTVMGGVASSGTYSLAVTAPTAASSSIAYSYSSDIDLRHVLPEGP